jgi:hypothetical protein
MPRKRQGTGSGDKHQKAIQAYNRVLGLTCQSRLDGSLQELGIGIVFIIKFLDDLPRGAMDPKVELSAGRQLRF